MDDLKYVIKRNDWNDFAETHFSELCENDPFISVEDYRTQVKSKELAHFSVFNTNGDVIAAFLIRIDESSKADEMVIVSAVGDTPHGENGEGLNDIITPFIVGLAKSSGCKYLRAHMNKKAVTRLFERVGYKTDEYICRMEVLSYGQ